MSKSTDKLFTHLWDVRRSIRYHTRRRAFYDSNSKIITGVSVILGTSALASVLAEAPATISVISAALVALLNTYDLIIGTTTKARLHHDLARDFSRLETEIELLSHSTNRISQESLADITTRRLEIEREEPPIYRALDVLAHYELAQAYNLPKHEFYKVGWWARCFSNWLHFSNTQFDRISEPPEHHCNTATASVPAVGDIPAE